MQAGDRFIAAIGELWATLPCVASQSGGLHRSERKAPGIELRGGDINDMDESELLSS